MQIKNTDNLEVGYSSQGMKDLDKSLDELLVKQIEEALDKLQKAVEEALDACWQGKSHDNFIKDFKVRINDTKKEINSEYEDLQSRFRDVTKYFEKQDEELYTSVK